MTVMKTKAYNPIMDNLIHSLKTDDRDDGRHEWLSPAHVGRELGLHINTVYRIVQKGGTPNFSLLSRWQEELVGLG